LHEARSSDGMEQLKVACPCLFSDDAAKKLMGIPPANSDSDSEKPDSSMGGKARGWLEMASAPVKAFQDRQQQNVARTERIDWLKAGSAMKLLSKEGSSAVRLSLSADGALVTWQSLEMVSGMPKESGVLALSAVREVVPVLQTGFLRSGGPVPRQWQLLADDQTAKFEAESEEDKDRWMSTVEELRHHEADAKAERKIGYTTRRKMGLEERRREAERRKAEVLKSCGGQGGMKHTAAAMMSRA
jgi:hypothetical protein